MTSQEPAAPGEVCVRTLRTDDRRAWERLFRAYIAFYGRTLDDAEYERAWRRLRADREIHGRVALAGGAPVGIVHFLTHVHTNADDVCYLQDLFTDPNARGRGIGEALIANVVDWARAQGCSRVYWHTQAENARARRLYDRVAEDRGFIVYQVSL